MTRPDLSALRIERAAPGASPRTPQRRGLPRWPLLLLVVLLLLGAAFWWRQRAPRSVETATVGLSYPYQEAVVLNASGYVVAQRKASVASKATGRLEWLGVAEGSPVRARELIARLESADVRAALEQSVANLKVAQASLEQARAEQVGAAREATRSRELTARGFLSEAGNDASVTRRDRSAALVQSAIAGIASARAAQHAAEVAVEQTLIRAPFDGVVLTKNANVGDTITPFSAALDTKGAVVTLADMNTLEVEADVAESSLQQVRAGQPCEIELDAIPQVRFTGTVSRLVPTVDRTKATVLAKVAFAALDPRILPEMSARVAFLSRPVSGAQLQPRLVVSARALGGAGTQVIVLRDGLLRPVAVRLGARTGDQVEVLSGLQMGDAVVLDPSADLREGQRAVARRPGG